MTAGWGETEVLVDVSSRRLAPVQHRHLPARGLLSLFSFLRAFLLTVINRNQGAPAIAVSSDAQRDLGAGFGCGFWWLGAGCGCVLQSTATAKTGK
jgi:hypothetical protein